MSCSFTCVRRPNLWKYLVVLCLVQLVGFLVHNKFTLRQNELVNDDARQTEPTTSQPPVELWFNTLRRAEGAIFNFSALGTPEYYQFRQTFHAGGWRSDFRSPFHKHYEVNCSAILSGHNQSIEDANAKIGYKQNISPGNKSTEEESVIFPPDRNVSIWMQDCIIYKKARKYPENPRTQEESSYPLAYILTVHKHAAQVERLFRAIYQPQHVYCFHVDTKAPEDFKEAIGRLTKCFNNAFLASTLEDVQYRGYTRLKADLNCMSDLIGYKWNYVINLCGEDFPLKTNLEIVRQMKAYGGKNDIPGVFPKQDRWFVSRTRNHHDFVNGELVRRPIRKPKPPHNALMYFGNAYYAATREYVHYILTSPVAQDILQYLSDSNSPDEHFWVTINKYPGVPGGFPPSTWASNVRFIKWTNSDEYAPCVGHWVRDVCIIGTGYLPYMARIPHLFMNKIHYGYDPLPMQCMEELLDYRTKVPNSIREFASDFPVTDIFQVSPDQKPAHLYRFMHPPTKAPPIGPLGVTGIIILVLGIFICVIVLCVQLGLCDDDFSDEGFQRKHIKGQYYREQRLYHGDHSRC